MKRTIKKPIISPDFTLKDIRKIRTYHAKLYASMTKEELEMHFSGVMDRANQTLSEVREKNIIPPRYRHEIKAV
jgi:hypothetical protein